jgi:hypothetical protein
MNNRFKLPIFFSILVNVPVCCNERKHYLIFIENDDEQIVPSIRVCILSLFVCALFIHLGSFGFFSIINKHINNKCSIMSQKIHHYIISID